METRQDWAAKADEYLKRVEAAISHVDHPRKKQVLQDLRMHLDQMYADIEESQRTPEAFAEAIERTGPPEEYAELLFDDQLSRARRTRWRIPAIILAAVTVAVAAYAFLWTKPAGRCSTLRTLGRDWSASPFFSRAGFSQIEPGMTASQVRDAIGYAESSVGFAMFITFVVLAIMWFFIYMIGKGRNWARITFLVLFIIGIPFAIMPLLQSLAANPISGFLGLAQTVIQIVALVFLFQKASTDWFRQMKANR